MSVGLTAAGVVLAAGDALLIAVAWRSRSVLAGIVGVAGLAVVGSALVGEFSAPRRRAAVAFGAVALVIATALYAIGQVTQRLLDEDPDKHP